MRVLLTGSSGRLGRHLASVLREAGHAVIGLDPAPGPDTQLAGSVASPALVSRAFADHAPDAVIHAGGLHQPDLARVPAQAFVDVNVSGTLNLLRAAAEAGAERFVFTSTTSLMVSQAVHDEAGTAAVWLDEERGPLAPRNVYGVTKLAAEGLCRVWAQAHAIGCVVLRTSRFFPDDPATVAGELLHRRLTVEDAARAHLLALERASAIGFDVLIISAPPPFARDEAAELKRDAAVIARHFPDAPALFAARGWQLPRTIARVYDPSRAERVLGFRCRAGFAELLDAMRRGGPLPFRTAADALDCPSAG